VTPIQAAQREITAELDALARRLGSSPVPDSLIVRVEFDRQTGMPRCVEVDEQRRRRVLGSRVA
jgi:hypothetical protein